MTTSLDDLLSHEEPEDPMPHRAPPAIGWLAARVGMQAALITALVYLALRVGGYAMSPLLLFALFAGLLVVWQATRAVSEPDGQVVRELVVRQAGARDDTPAWYAGQDGMIYALRRWETRLSWAATSPDRFAHTLPRYLCEIVDERLRQRHGLTRASDPARARAICGERLWTFLHEPARYQRDYAVLAEMINEMERL